MSLVNMTWGELPFDGTHDNGHQEGFVFQVIGPSFIYPSHRQPVVLSPHRCNNAESECEVVVPVIAAITFERSAARTHSFVYPNELEHPRAEIYLTTEPSAYGHIHELARGYYETPESVRLEETYRDLNGDKVADVQFEMNEVKALYLNIAFECNPECPFSYGGTFDLWVHYWGYWNYCKLRLTGAPDHGALVDMKYGRQPRT